MELDNREVRARLIARVVLIGFVLAAFGFGVITLQGAATGRPASGLPGKPRVLVAARDLAHRTPVTAQDVTSVAYSPNDIPPGALFKVEEIRGLAVAIDVLKGQPLTSNMLVETGEIGVGAHASYLAVPSGFVAVTVPTSESAGVAGYIQAGDYISMIAVVPGARGLNVRTVFDNVHVLKVGAASDGSLRPRQTLDSGGLASSLTVVVTSCQAEFINWFLINGSLRYELESSKDYQPHDKQLDPSCPSVTAAPGVRLSDVASRWPDMGINVPVSDNGTDQSDPAHPGVGCAHRDTRPYGCTG